MNPFRDITNPGLIKAIYAVAANDCPETRRAVYGAFQGSTLLIPLWGEIKGQPDNEWRVQSEAVDVRFIGGKNEQGQTILYAFTDVESLLAWRPKGCRYMGMSAQGVFRFVIDNDYASILVNCKGPVGGILTRSEIEELVEGRIPEKVFGAKKIEVAPGTKMKFCLPAKPPSEELIGALLKAFTSLSSIAEAYMFQVYLGQEVPELVVGLVFSEGGTADEMPAAVQSLLEVIKTVLPEGEFISFLELKGEMLQDVRNLAGAKLYSTI